MFKINNITTRRRSGNVIVNLWTYFIPFPNVSILDFEEVMLAGDHLSFRGRYWIK